MAGLVSSLRLSPERMSAQLEPGLLATDLADYLVKRGVAFREAHSIVGRVVRLAEAKGIGLASVPQEDLQAISRHFGPDVGTVFEIKAALANRTVVGGTALPALKQQLQAAKERIQR